MRIIYCGSGEFGVPSLEAIISSQHELVHIYTQPAQPAGRGRKLRPTPVAEWAAERKLSFTEVPNINEPEVVGRIAELKAELLVVIAFGQKIGEEVINKAAHRAINVHGSLLPKYRGAAPINWAIINGESETGVSIIRLAERMDAGDVLAEASTKIEPGETTLELHARLSKLAAPVLAETIDSIAAGTAVYKPQDHSKATKAPKLKKSDGFINWDMPAETICNRIRGLYPWPEAESNYVNKKTGKCERVIFAQCEVVSTNSKQYTTPGMLDENLNIVCGRGAIKVLKIKPAGSAMMDFKSFVNGRHCQPGDFFMPIEPQQ